jgi:hypothetical protein
MSALFVFGSNMTANTVQEQTELEQGKCVKCGKRNATQEDQLCVSCRFMNTSIEHIREFVPYAMGRVMDTSI